MSDTFSEMPRARQRPARPQPPQPRRRRRVAAVGVFVAALVAVGAVVALSLHAHLPFGLSASHTKHSSAPTGPTGPVKPASTRTVAVSLLGSLSAPAARVAAVPYGTAGALFLGGYDAAGATTDTVQNFQAATVTSAGALPVPEASSVAAVLGQDIYLFGGSAGSSI